MLANPRNLRVLAVFQQHGVTIQEYLFNYLWKNFGIRIDCRAIEEICRADVARYDLILNVACNDAIHTERLAKLGEWSDEAGIRMLNRIEGLRNCRRIHFSRLMRANGLNAARVEYVPSRDALLAMEGLRYPLIVRQEFSHLGTTMRFVENPEAAAKLSESGFRDDTIAIEFHDFRSPDGLYRKYRCALLGDQVIARHVISSPEWNIHSNSRQPERMKEHQSEDEAFWARTVTEADVLLRAKSVIGLDYTIADYALDDAGQPFFFEMNPCYSVIDQRAFQREWAHQLHAVHRYCDAYATFLFDAAGRATPHPDFVTLPMVL